MERNRRILVVDDQQDLREQLAKLLMRSGKKNETLSLVQQMRSRLLGAGSEEPEEGNAEDDEPTYLVDTAGQGADAFEMVKQASEKDDSYAVMFLDMRMPPGWDGMETATKIREIDKKLEIVIMTAYADHDQAQIADTVGTPEKLLYIKKPFQAEEIHQLALSLTSKWSLEKTETERKRWLENLLRGMSKIKSATVVADKDFYLTTLKSILNFTQGSKGFIVVQNGDSDQWGVHATHEVDQGEAEAFIKEHARRLSESRTTQHFEGKYLLPLKRDKYSAVAVIYDVVTRNDPEWYKFLSLLTMTATEVLSNASFIKKNIEKERFSAIGIAMSKLSHESKNMLNHLLGYANMLKENLKGDEKSTGLVNNLLESGEVMLKQLQNILVFSKDEDISLEKCDLMQIVRHGCDTKSIPNCNGTCNIDGPEKLTMKGSADLLKRVFSNLIINSCAAKEKPEIKVKISVKDKNISIEFTDNGPGIPKDIRKNMFDPFVSVGKEGGIGLGLSIVRQIVEKHDGSIKYDEKYQDGAKFIINLPQQE